MLTILKKHSLAWFKLRYVWEFVISIKLNGFYGRWILAEIHLLF